MMFNTLKSKIIFLITLIMVLTATVIMYFTHRYVGDAMLHAEESAARNVLQLAELNIGGGYNRLLSDKIEILSRLQAELRNISRLGASVFAEHRALADAGLLSEDEVKTRALAWLKRVEFKGKLFVVDADATVIAHTDRRYEGTSLATAHDLKGRRLLRVIQPDRLPETGKKAVFVWDPPDGNGRGTKNMGFFMPIGYWGWTLGATIDFQDIEAESQRKMQQIINVLRKTFAKIQLAGSGYAFLFSGDRKLLIPPRGVDPANADAMSRTPQVRQVLRQLIATSRAGKDSIRYTDPFSGKDEPVEAFASYFKAFDWYLAVVVPVREIKAPAQAVVTRQSLLIGILFLASLAIAFPLVAKISRPLNLLTAYAKELPSHDFTGTAEEPDSVIRQLPSRYHDEVGRLAEAFSFMEVELKRNIQNAIESTAAKERLEREAAEEANRAKGEFLANMSHEIRTPIHAMLGMSEMLLATPLEDAQKHFVDTIRGSGRSLLTIINDILDFSKIEAMKMELEDTEFSVADLVELVAQQFAPTVQAKGIEFAVTIDRRCEGVYRGDPGRVRQILSNLCSNAVKFTDSGHVEIRLFPQPGTDDQVRFEVRDSGIGVPAEAQAHIFDSFAQLDGSTTRKYGGTGLGLAISRRLAELMGGEIGMRSTEGRGATFWFTVRLAACDATADADPVTSCSAAGLRVLLVEGHPVSRNSLGERLENWRAYVESCATSSDAAARLRDAARRATPFEVLVAGDALPGVEQLIDAVEHLAGPHGPRVIELTSASAEGATSQFPEQWRVTRVRKPARRAELAVALGLAGVTTAANDAADDTPALAPTHVLVAEDNPVNQELAAAMLGAMNCSCVIVGDGRLALDALAREHFDLVLMDCQMPELDGFSATRELRSQERTTNQPHVPVIALTASAMHGDRERCIAAGMDDYLSKPFDSAQLRDVVARWARGPGETAVDTAPDASPLPDQEPPRQVTASDASIRPARDDGPTEPPILDQRVIGDLRELGRTSGADLITQLAVIYLESSPPLVEQLHAALAAGDTDLVRRSAHALKSSSGNIGATAVSELCRRLEQAGREDDITAARALRGGFDRDYGTLCEHLGSIAGPAAA